MSLVSLTFGSGKAQSVSGIRMFVQKPLQNLKINPNEENKLEVIKASQFFGHENVFVIAKVASGVLLQDMSVDVNGKICKIVGEIESKLGKTNAKKGMLVSFFLQGIDKDELQKGQVVNCVM